ncbi:hypothetical protein [Limnohabitans curvus]|uniref:hypothetical protein n=1 Tax=Limnohabitans curvus TaxID=323423 RepID=UPI001B86A819|nr:hypothetical protein [Limnohabitans curvus]
MHNNGADALIVTSNGNFIFPTPVAFNGSFNVTVGTQPTGQTCSVVNNSSSGAGVTSNVNSVNIVCSTNTYTIAGSVSGLANGQQVTLHNNGADALIVTSNGNFIFPTPVAFNGSFNVTVGTQPTGQTCSVVNNSSSGAGVTSNVNSVNIVCVVMDYFKYGGLTWMRPLWELRGWSNAYTYCKWYGWRLPTSTELWNMSNSKIHINLGWVSGLTWTSTQSMIGVNYELIDTSGPSLSSGYYKSLNMVMCVY